MYTDIGRSEVEEKYVYCTEDRYVIDPEEAVNLVDENTIGICTILGTTYTGEYEDTKAINDLLEERQIDCYIHGIWSLRLSAACLLLTCLLSRCGFWRLCCSFCQSGPCLGLPPSSCCQHQRIGAQVRPCEL